METERGQCIPAYLSMTKGTCSFKGDLELWSQFKQKCKELGISICYALEGLMTAFIEGQKVRSTLINPVTVNLTMQHVVERPRRVKDFFNGGEDPLHYIVKYGSCFRLNAKGLYPGRIGYCQWCKRWIFGYECSACVHSGESSNE